LEKEKIPAQDHKVVRIPAWALAYCSTPSHSGAIHLRVALAPIGLKASGQHLQYI
jgi:hypothetical protein